MDRLRFDNLTRSVSLLLSRRTFAGMLSLGVLGLPGLVEAKKKRKKKKKVTFNDFGCVDVGKFCKNSDQCCSGICQGKKDKRRCAAHDTGGCQVNQDTCLLVEAPSCGQPGANCFLTTGKGSFCGFDILSDCVVCARDADCQAFGFGPGAACVVCGDCNETGTLCIDPGD